MIIPELSGIIISNQNPMSTPNERNDFEILCDKVIEKAILNYKNYSQIYIDNNKKILEIEDNNIKSILQEATNINNLSGEDFPLINYFYTSKYPNYEIFLKEFSLVSKSQYPVLNNYLNACNDKSFEFLKNFEYINPFVKYTLKKYSNKISREQSKKIIIKNELDIDDEMKNYLIILKKDGQRFINICQIMIIMVNYLKKI